MPKDTQIPEVGDFIIVCGEHNMISHLYGDRCRVIKILGLKQWNKAEVIADSGKEVLFEGEYYIV